MKHRNRLNVSRKYLLSYLIGSIIPILLLSLVYLYTSTARLKQSIDESMLDKLALIKNNIDIQIKNMESSGMHFSSKLKLLDNYRASGANEISFQLNLYKQNYPFADEVLFHIRGDKNIFNTNEVIPYYQFEEGFSDKVNFNMTQLYKNINSTMNSRLIPTKLTYPYSANTGKYLVYMQSVPFLDTSPQGTMVFLIDKKSFENIVVDYMGDFTGYICIFDPSMYTIFEQSNGIDISPDIESRIRRLKGVGIFKQTIHGRNYMLVRSVSENSGYSYVALMPYDKFYASVRTELNYFSLIAVIIIVIAVIIAVFLAMRLYAPIKRLINDTLLQSVNKHDTEDNETDVFERIRYAYKNVLTCNNELLLQIGNQRSLVRDQLLTSILCGSFTNKDNLALHMKCANVSFDYDYFFALYVKFHEKSTQPANAVADYMEKIYFKNGKAYGVELEDGSGLAVIINLALSDNEKADDLRRNTAVMFKNMLTQHGFTELSIGVGDLYRDILDIDMSLIEAEKAMNEDPQTGSIILHARSNKKDKTGYMQPAAERAVYYHSLVKGNADAAVATLDTMFRGMECHTNSFVIMRSFCFYIFNTIIEAANIVGLDVSENEMAKSAAFSDLDAFKKCAADISVDICRYVAQQQAIRSEQLKNRIIEYVAANFSNYDMSIDKLAKLFNVSQSYLGNLFKNETGYSFIQYMTLLRMDFIKQKLVTTEIPIKEIVQSAGYADTANFIRKFKASEGVTPGQYREMSCRLSQPEISGT